MTTHKVARPRAVGVFLVAAVAIVVAAGTPAPAATVATELNPAIPARPATHGEVFFQRDVTIVYSSGTVLLSGQPDGSGNVSVDDVLRLSVTRPDGSTVHYIRDYSNGCQGFISSDPPQDLTALFQPGANQVHVELQDQCGAILHATSNYLVVVNRPPTAHGQALTTAEDTALPITLTGSDPDGDPLTFTIVSGPQHGTLTGAGPNVVYTPAPNYSGPDSFVFQVDDGHGNVATATVFITVEAVNDPPVCSGVVSDVVTLWPPNHKLETITLTGATDIDSPVPVITVTGVTQDEPVDGLGDGDTAPDAVAGASSNQVQLRAERSGRGDGRVYRVTATATDTGGATCSGTVLVGVPKSQGGPGSVPVDSGLVVNSFSSS